MSDPLPPFAPPIRSNAAEVRNRPLSLPAAQRLSSLPPEARRALADLLRDLEPDARERAEQSWRRRKAPMAAYWMAVSVYAGHLRRVLRSTSSRGGQRK